MKVTETGGGSISWRGLSLLIPANMNHLRHNLSVPRRGWSLVSGVVGVDLVWRSNLSHVFHVRRASEKKSNWKGMESDKSDLIIAGNTEEEIYEKMDMARNVMDLVIILFLPTLHFTRRIH